MRTVCDEWVEDQMKKKTTTVIYAVGGIAAFPTKEKALKWLSFLDPKSKRKIYKITTTREEVA